MNIKNTDKQYIAHTYNRFDLLITRGKGALCYDENGREYIDMTSGIGVNAFGYSDDEVVKAITDQASTLTHTSNLYYTAPSAELAKILCERTGMKKVFFSNSGAESNECAIKAARKYAAAKKGGEYFHIVTMNRSFHGRTLTTLAATGQDSFHTQFLPLTEGFLYTEPEDIDGLRDLIGKYPTAAVMLECIQGEGGVNVLSKEYLQAVQALCDEKDILLIVDEVQTGNGRTGALYSYMHYDLHPDIVSTAKGLAGGLPMGATLLSEKVEDIFSYGDHGSTFGANPVCAAAALSVQKRLDGDFLNEVKKKGEYIRKELEKTGAKVSGLGLMLGVTTEKPVSDVIRECMDKGVLCLSAKDKLRLLPPLNIGYDELKKAVEIIKTVLCS